jgi:thiamine biosynthesis lipoprotein
MAMIKHRFRAMGSHILIALASRQTDLLGELQEAAGWFEEWEQRLSRFRPDSELNYVNQTAGQTIQVSQVFWDVLQASFDAYRLSGQLVTPTILPALEVAGYSRSFEGLPANTASPVKTEPVVDALSMIKYDPATHRVRTPFGVRLDFGGIAKGWAAHQTMLRLQHLGAVLVDAGGDIAISASQPEGQPWLISVLDPLNDAEDLDMLAVHQGGVATSGRDYRRWMKNGEPQHHIIDPRSGQPAETDLLSATVVAPNVIVAETAAKTVMILGSHLGLDWLEAQDGLAGLVVLEDGTVMYSKDSQTVFGAEYEE